VLDELDYGSLQFRDTLHSFT